MTTTINASTSSGLVVTPDNSGNVLLQYNGQGAPAFFAYLSTNTSISTGSFVKVTLDTEVFDTNNNFASSRFTPTVAGYYQISGGVRIPTAGDMLCAIYKNGSIWARGVYISGSTYNSVASTLVYCNGSTDYIELYMYSGSVSTVSGIQSETWMSGCLLRGA